jgi:hypothetical protein
MINLIIYPVSGLHWSLHRTVTIDHTQCGASSSSNFPVLVNLTDTSFRTVANGGLVNNTVSIGGQTVPADLAFFSDSGLSNLMTWEIDRYNAATGELIAWVSIPIVSNTVDTVFYLAWGSPTIISFQGGAPGIVWTNNGNYGSVFHFKNGTTLDLSDATINANNGTPHGTSGSPSAGTGQIDGGMTLAGVSFNQYVSLANNPLNLLNDFTISFWSNKTLNGGGNNNDRFVHLQPSTATNFQIYTDGTSSQYGIQLNRSGTQIMNLFYGTWLLTQWVHIVVVISGNTSTFYRNGVSIANTGTATAAPGSTIGYTIGTRTDANSTTFFNGTLDEVRFAPLARNADWVTCEYNNQKTGSTFLIFGPNTP